MGLFGKKKGPSDDEVAAQIMKERAEKKAADEAAAKADAAAKAAALKSQFHSSGAAAVAESKVTGLVSEMVESPTEEAKGAQYGTPAERLALMADMCSSPNAAKCAKRAVEVDGIKACMATMAALESLEVQLEGCRALSAIVVADDAAKEVVATAGGIATIAKAMKAYPKEAAVQLHGCRALGTLCLDGAYKNKAMAAGAIGAIVVAVREHAAAEAALHGCNALSRLCGDVRGDVSDEESFSETAVHWKVINEGGFAAIVAALKAQPATALVQQHGCGAINGLCVGEGADADARADKATDAGALEAALATLTAAETAAKPAVAEFGCLALGTLVRGETCEARKQRAIDAGAFTAVMGAMAAHSGVVGVLEEGVGALINLCDGTDDAASSRRTLASEAGVKAALVAAMSAQPGGDPALWKHGKDMAAQLA